jgi:predicted peroxiredoxin
MESAMTANRIGLVITHAGDEPEKATLPFMIATVAQTMDVGLFIVLQGEGVRMAVKGGTEGVHAEGLSPVEDLLSAVLASGAQIMVCSPCLTTRGFTEDDLREGFFVGGAAKIVEAMLECENFLTY